jgi:hypothetical protein
MSDFAIFHIEGGIGKHVAATAVVECYKKNHPDTQIIVVCAWPEVFLLSPFIHRVYRIGSAPYFYQDYIYNKKVKVFAQEPYKQTSHLTKQKHLIETWCDMIGVEYGNERPRVFFNFREKEVGCKLFAKLDKPLLLFQPFGGPGKEHQQHPYSWTRDIHPEIAQQLVNKLSTKYDIIHICYEFHPTLQNCTRFDQIVSKKVLFNLLGISDARLLIDSSLQHAAAAMNLPSTVVWVATESKLFGYSIHKNVEPETKHLQGTIDSYLFDYNFTGTIHECPYSSPNEIFNIDKILSTL